MASEPTDLIREADRALNGITPGPWEAATAPADGSNETPAEYVAATLRPDSALLYVVCAPSPDPERWAYVLPAITGDGPTSRANAAFIAAAPDLVRHLRDALVAEQKDSKALMAVADEARETADRFREGLGEAKAALAEANAAIERARHELELSEDRADDYDAGVSTGMKAVLGRIRRAIEGPQS